MLDLFRDGFCICGGPFGSGMWKNWKVAALKYFRPVTYMAWQAKRLKLYTLQVVLVRWVEEA